MTLKPYQTALVIICCIIPIACVFGTSSSLKFSSIKAGDDVKFRPPSWFFGFIWTILLIILGLCMGNSLYMLISKSGYTGTITKGMITATLVLYFIITVLLCIWLSLYSHHYREWAIWILAILIMLFLFCYTMTTFNQKMGLVPFITWALFALFMSTAENIIETKQK